jgi:hypothetical protein
MNDTGGEGKTYFGNLKTFYILLYSSAAVFLIALALIFSDVPGVGILFIAVASIVMIISFVLFYIFLYRVWKFTIAKAYEAGIVPSIQSAGQAVGYLFIPLFGIYWIFRAIGKLPVEINRVADRYNVQMNVPKNLGYSIATFAIIGFIPFVGYVTGAINFLILLPIFIKNSVEVCELIDASEVTPDTTIEVIKTEKIEWELIKEFSDLFDKEKYGINYFIGISLFISLSITRTLRIFLIESFQGFSSATFDYLIFGIAYDFAITILFILVIHSFKKSWILPFIWGVVIVIMSLIRTQAIVNAQNPLSNDLINIPMLHIERLLGDFLLGFAFMLGLVFAVNVWGAKIWSFLICIPASYLIYKAMYTSIAFLPSPATFDFGYFFLEYDLINSFGGIITGLLIYGALFLHFDNLQINKQKIEPLTE